MVDVFDTNAFEEVSISEAEETLNETKEKPLIKQSDDDTLMDRKKHFYNIAVLIVCCLMLFGGCYSKATPKDMQNEVVWKQELYQKESKQLIYPNMDHVQLTAEWLYAIGIYSLPALIISPFSGLLVNKFDTRTSLISFILLVFIGSTFCSFSLLLHKWWLFIVGRMLFGTGQSSLRITINVVIKEIVPSEDLGFYMQFPRAAAKLASIADGVICSLPLLQSAFNIHANYIAIPFFIGTLIIGFTLPLLVIFYLEPKAKQVDVDEIELVNMKKEDAITDITKEETIESYNNMDKDDVDISLSSKWRQFIFVLMNAISEPIKFVWSHCKTFTAPFWLAFVIGFFWQIVTFCYCTILPQFLIIFGFRDDPTSFFEQPSNIRQIPMYLAVISPAFGLVADYAGKQRWKLLVFGVFGIFVHHGINFVFTICDYYGKDEQLDKMKWIIYPNLFFLGLSNSFMAGVMTPSIAFIVKDESLSVAYGLCATVSFFANFLITLMTGTLSERLAHKELNLSKQILCFEHMMLSLMFISALILTILVFVFALRYKDKLYPPDDDIDDEMDMDDEDVEKMKDYEFSNQLQEKQRRHTLPLMRAPSRHRMTSADYINIQDPTMRQQNNRQRPMHIQCWWDCSNNGKRYTEEERELIEENWENDVSATETAQTLKRGLWAIEVQYLYLKNGQPVQTERRFNQRSYSQPVEWPKIDPYHGRTFDITDAIKEILFCQELSFGDIRKKIVSRTSLYTMGIHEMQQRVEEMATYNDKRKVFSLKKEFAINVNWEHSNVLTPSEKEYVRKAVASVEKFIFETDEAAFEKIYDCVTVILEHCTFEQQKNLTKKGLRRMVAKKLNISKRRYKDIIDRCCKMFFES